MNEQEANRGMDDLISRKASLSLAKDLCVPTADGIVYKHRCIDPDEIRELPSAQPERKKGEWINSYTNNVHYMRCSKCGTYIEATFFANDYDCNFCPHCGANMRGEEDG